MGSKIRLLFFVICSFLSAQSLAQNVNFAGVLGFRSMQMETDIAGASVNSKTGFQAGILLNVPLQSFLEVRSGVLYVQRHGEITNTAKGTVDINYAYFDVPAQLALRFNEAASVFGGTRFAFNQSKEVECSANASCEASSVKSVLFPIELGVEFRFLPQMGAELYYEYIPGELSANVQNMKTIGINLTFQFE